MILRAPDLSGADIEIAGGDFSADFGTFTSFERFTVNADLGDNRIVTGDLDDTIFTGEGNDVLVGGGGADQLGGGWGADLFLFRDVTDFGTGLSLDRIWDFAEEQGDRIDLSGVSDGEFSFIGASAFTGAGTELRYESLGWDGFRVEGDLDGDGAADFAFLVHAADLTQSSFVL